MAALLRWYNASSGADLALDDAHRLLEGDPLVADLFLSLYVEAPADVGDPVPEGVVKPRYWARAFDRRAVVGSKLWMLRFVKPVARVEALARTWAEEAVQWLVADGRVASIEVDAKLVRQRVEITLVVTSSDESTKTFKTEVPHVV